MDDIVLSKILPCIDWEVVGQQKRKWLDGKASKPSVTRILEEYQCTNSLEKMKGMLFKLTNDNITLDYWNDIRR